MLSRRELERRWEQYLDNLEDDEEGMSFSEFIEDYYSELTDKAWDKEMEKRLGIY